MLSTYLNYQLITRDMPKTISRIESQPMVARETNYFQENIGKVKSIEEFVADNRLFKYAMKAFGLADMDYAKAFMVKAMKEGVSDPNSFANKLTDKRYAEFVATFNFAARNDRTTTYIPAQQGVADRYTLGAVEAGVDFDDPLLKQINEDYLSRIGEIRTIDEFLADDALYAYAMKAHGLDERIGDKAFMRQILQGGIADEGSLANRQEDKAYAEFVASFNFAAYGERATTYSKVVDGVVDKYTRQTLEEDAGKQNEGVRLALYFERKIGSIEDAYGILADRALSQVVRTALGIPESMASADIDKQAAMIEARLDIESLSDPKELSKFMQRFTALWEVANPTQSTASLATVLFTQPVEFGISTDTLLTIARMRS